MLNKKILLLISGILALFVVVMGTSEPFRLCGDSWRTCMDINYNLSLVLMSIVPFSIFALITYFMRDEVYTAWVRVALWMLGISMVLIVITPEPETGGFGPQISFGKPDVALLTCALFVFISTVLIAWKYWQLRK